MIEINLIPDVKQELLKAQRTRSVVISASIFTGIIAVGVVVLLLIYIYGIQLVRTTVLDSQIDAKAKELSQVDDLSKILTIQNQLGKISELNGQKYMASRTFDVLAAITPAEPNQVAFSKISIQTPGGTDVDGNTTDSGSIILEGQTRSYDSLEVFKKTVSNTLVQYTEDGETKTENLADSISTTDVSYGEDDTNQKVVRFIMTIQYNPELFSPKATNVSYKQSVNGNVTDSYIGIPRFTQRAEDVKENQ
jgi:hypothetical protein